MITAFTDAFILADDAMVEGHALLVKDGKILDIVGHSHVPAAAKVLSCPNQIIAPGLIDAQVNGGGNILFNNSPTAEAGLAIAKAHRAYGTTSLLLTCITDKPEITRQAVVASQAARQQDKGILGIHIEGPHLSVERRGVHHTNYLRPLTSDDLALYRRQADEVVLVTVAPENVTPTQIESLSEAGVTVSLGHTYAAPEAIRAALAAGATGFTHLFNTMGPMEARKPGPAGVALDDRNSWCGIIADGFHVSNEMIRLAHRAKLSGKLFLVSDAMPPAASADPQPFKLYDETITVKNGQCHNSEGRFAGAALTLADGVRHCVQKTGIDLIEALRMASTYPAEFLGIGDRLGKLLPGYVADLVAFDPQLNLQVVRIAGH